MHVKYILDILAQCNKFKHIPTMPIPFPLKKKKNLKLYYIAGHHH